MAASSGKSWLVKAFVAMITARADTVPRAVITRCRPAKVTTSDSRAVAYDSAVKLVYTPSRHPGSVGLLSFPVPKAEAQLPSFLTPLLYLLILLSVGLVVWYYGARRARARRLAGRPGYS